MTSPMRGYNSPGLAGFAAILALMVGLMNLIYGLLLLFNSEWVVLAEEGLFYFDVTAWAWVLVVFGAVQMAAGFGILLGRTWARLIGMAWAALLAVGHMFALPAFPFWSLLIIALAVLTIWALAGGLGERS
jgi:hypothetical protein